MSDTSQGGGWWMASDGKWYPPESIPAPPAPPPPPPKAAPPAGPGTGPGVLFRTDTPLPSDQGSFWKRLGLVRQAVLIVVAAIFLLWAVGKFGGGGSSGPKADSPEYTAALDYCNATAGASWYAAHPGASAASDADLRGYAGAVNRCLIDRLGVSPKYLPADKPIQGIRP